MLEMNADNTSEFWIKTLYNNFDELKKAGWERTATKIKGELVFVNCDGNHVFNRNSYTRVFREAIE